jgi:uncharacterized membrane protein
MKFITELLERHCSEKQRQWLWFAILWLGGLLSVLLLSSIIRLMMRV